MTKKTRRASGVNGEYSKLLKDIRSFVGFDYDLRKPLSPSQKGKITKYHNMLFGQEGLTRRAVKLYRPRNEKHLKVARSYARVPGGFSELKAIPIPAANPENTKVDFDSSGNLVIRDHHVSRRYAEFNPLEMVQNPSAEIRRAIRQLGNAKAFTVNVGNHETHGSIDRTGIENKVREIMTKYQVGNEVSLADGRKRVITEKQTWDKFLNGIVGYSFHNQASYAEYKIAARHAQIENSKKARRIRRRAKRGN